MSKLFIKSIINFLFQLNLHAQNPVWMRVPHLIFAAALWCNREYLGGRVGMWGVSFPQQFTLPYKEWYKRSFCYLPIAVGRGILSRRQWSEKPNFIWAYQPLCLAVCNPETAALRRAKPVSEFWSQLHTASCHASISCLKSSMSTTNL
jgi:hypothetical protein